MQSIHREKRAGLEKHGQTYMTMHKSVHACRGELLKRIKVAIFTTFATFMACGVQLCAQGPAGLGDWPQWRGAQRDGLSQETGLARTWPEGGPPIIWQVDHVGLGYSSLAIKDGRIFTLGNLDGVEHIICLKADDGSLVWAVQPTTAASKLKQRVADALARFDANRDGGIDKAEAQDEAALRDFELLDMTADGVLSPAELRGAYGGFHDDMGAGPRGTPCVDGNRVFTLGCMGDLACLEAETGQTVWSLNLVDDFGGRHTGRGFSESPLVDGERLVVSPGGAEGAVIALEKSTGKLVWLSREVEERIQYASAIAANIAGERMIVQFGSLGLFGLSAHDGRLLWRYGHVSSGVANVCTPIVWNDHVFASSAYNTGSGLVKVSRDNVSGDKASGADEEWQATEVYFNTRLANHHGGVVRVGDYLYGTGNNSLVAMEFFTGKVAWVNRSVGKGSLIGADGMLYVVGENHNMCLVEATPESYREQGRVELPDLGHPTWSHPVIAGGRLYIRIQQRLIAFDVQGGLADAKAPAGGNEPR